ncbi:MAG: universal stress protein [Terracidiphilus sp.]
MEVYDEKGSPIVYRHILVGLSQSNTAHRALRRAIELASYLDASLTAVAVVPALPPQAAYAVGLGSDALRTLKGDEQSFFIELLELAQREAAQHAIRIETALSEGPVVVSLIEAVQKNQVDLLVLGIHHDKGLLEWLYGNTTHELAQRAICDILGVH